MQSPSTTVNVSLGKGMNPSLLPALKQAFPS